MIGAKWLEGDEGKKFVQEWNNFVITIFSPWTVCLIAITLFFAYRTAGQRTSENLAIFTFMLSIFSGVTGGMISKSWMDLTEQRVLVTRGKSAIRSLVLLIFNIGSAQLRIREYSAEIKDLDDDEDLDCDLVANWMKEESLRLNNLREEAINSVENWTDIIPEAKIRPELAKFDEEVSRVANYQSQHAQIEEKLKSIKQEAGSEKEEKEQLQKQLRAVEAEWRKAQDELKETQAKLERSVLGGVFAPTVTLSSIGMGWGEGSENTPLALREAAKALAETAKSSLSTTKKKKETNR